MANEFVYTMQGLSKTTSRGKSILKDIWLSFLPGAKIGVLGLNGSGKSTLLRIMAGEDKEFTGEAYPLAGVKIGYLPQEPQLDESKTVKENVEEGVAEFRAIVDQFNEVSMKFGEVSSDEEMNALFEEQGRLQDIIDSKDLWDLDRHVGIAMDALNVPVDAETSTLSGGERRRVALARLLLARPDMLLLDEPTNHLDADSVAWLEQFLAEYPGTVVAVTHDRYFLDNVAGWILELDRGAGIPYEGNYTGWLEQKSKRLQQQQKEESNRQKILARELEWVRSSQKARQSKGKARMNAYDSLLTNDGAEKIQAGVIFIPPGPRLGDIVIEAEGVTKGYGGRTLIDGLSFVMPRGAIMGVIGANGAGKTTLMRMITGTETPDGGKLDLGATVQAAYVDQSRGGLDPDKTAYEEISGGYDRLQLGQKEVATRAYCTWFNIRGDMQQQKTGQLSGGERNRVHMAKLVKSGGNLLILDEPTNDLDVDTLRSLEDAIAEFAGSAIVISHDRWFLNRIATHILSFEGDGHCEFIEGNYDDYVEDRRRRLGDDADKPGRSKFRRLAH
ncbi:MAG: energy-dependent translational throttle protein EttA [Proteobacteria bacterium]|nr:energy-dependent translational throttle protein EttA [Pseudomonadota bacterium]